VNATRRGSQLQLLDSNTRIRLTHNEDFFVVTHNIDPPQFNYNNQPVPVENNGSIARSDDLEE